jgi:hypothetical protein
MGKSYTHEVMYVTPGQEEPYIACVLGLLVRPHEGWHQPRDPQFGLWRTTEISGQWPKVINIWESPSWEERANSFKHQFLESEDAFFEEWWNRNLTLRSGGFDRQLSPAPFSPDTAELRRSGIHARAFLHEFVRVPFGEAPEYLDRLNRDFRPAARERGWQLVGAFTVTLRPREVLTIWAIDDWTAFGALLAAKNAPDLKDWFAYRDSVVSCSEEMPLLPGRVNPLGPWS